MNPMTVREAMQQASRFFESNNIIDGPFLAEYIIRHCLEWDRTAFLTRLQDPLPEDSWGKIKEIMERRANGEPLQYIFGEQEFYGLPFHVNPSVLIPRPETELLVEEALQRIPEIFPEDQTIVVVDVGTGSGAIIVSMAVFGSPRWKYLALDISPDALKTAESNARSNGVGQQISFLEGDLLSPFQNGTVPINVLLSNPPYIPSGDIAGLDTQVKDHEPLSALDGGQDGLDLYRRMINQLPPVIGDKAFVGFEVGMGQAEDVKAMLEDTGLFQETYIIDDYAGIGRHVIAIRS
ncbi:MAG TPA: peptide chain release factor N(5)-glutamine methyltransferase [Paenibacillaceae bacterium]|nr:peptide chain release factor N(5)-glutamine methyltransferase [Paenibacillaceae bacterium]